MECVVKHLDQIICGDEANDLVCHDGAARQRHETIFGIVDAGDCFSRGVWEAADRQGVKLWVPIDEKDKARRTGMAPYWGAVDISGDSDGWACCHCAACHAHQRHG